jgi:hypothetical protein
MHPSPSHRFNSAPTHSGASPQPNPLAERAYRGITIAAMVALLASLLSLW